MKRMFAPLVLALAAAPLVVPTLPAAAQQGQSDHGRNAESCHAHTH